MILEHHYDDEVLIAFLNDEPAARRDPHLSNCRPCAETLHTLRSMSDVLQAEAVWDERELDETPRVETMEFLRAKQREVAAAQAATWLKALLAQPRETWASTIAAHPEWKTVAMVRAMVAEAERTVFKNPAEANRLAQIAVDWSQPLAASIRAEALREYGFTLYYTGSTRQALSTTCEAESISVTLPDPLLTARLWMQRALILSDMGRHIEGLDLVAKAAVEFASRNDSGRFVSARRTQGMTLYRLRRFEEARAVFRNVKSHPGAQDLSTQGAILQNLAACDREIGDLDSAVQNFLAAVDAFQRLNQPTGIGKAQWHLARVFVAQGRYDDALQLLRSVREAFAEMEMLQDVALVTIDIAHVQGVLGQQNEVIALCREAISFFNRVGLTESEGALTALALIKDSATSGRFTPEVADVARKHVSRPRLQFAFLGE